MKVYLDKITVECGTQTVSFILGIYMLLSPVNVGIRGHSIHWDVATGSGKTGEKTPPPNEGNAATGLPDAKQNGYAMKKYTLFTLCLLLFVGLFSSAALPAEVEPDPQGYGRNYTNFYSEIANYDLAPFFPEYNASPYNRFIGFIGNDLQRFYIHFTEVKRSVDDPYRYLVRGKTRVKNNICDVAGTITILRSGRLAEQDASDFTEGFILAQIDFAEDSKQAGTGTITGQMFTEFYLDEQGVMFASDVAGNKSLQFSCIWTSYKTGAKKICNFGIWRIPHTGLPEGVRLDHGDGEFSPGGQYSGKGWKSYIECRRRNWNEDNPFCREEARKWWTAAERATDYVDPVQRIYGYLSAALPAGWTVAEEARSISFKPKKGSTSVVVVAVEVGAADAAALARERAALWGEMDSALILPHGGGFLVSTKRARRWLAVTDGWMLEIGVSQELKDEDDVRMLLHSFSINPATPQHPGLAKALDVLRAKPHIESWLGSLGGASLQGSPL